MVSTVQKRDAGLSETPGPLWLPRIRDYRIQTGQHDGCGGPAPVCEKNRRSLSAGGGGRRPDAEVWRHCGNTHHHAVRPPRGTPREGDRFRIYGRNRIEDKATSLSCALLGTGRGHSGNPGACAAITLVLFRRRALCKLNAPRERCWGWQE